MVTLINREPLMRSYTLDHEVCCRDTCHCTKVKTARVDHDRKTGNSGYKIHSGLSARCVTLAAKGTEGDRVSGLPDSVKNIEKIKNALNRGHLVAVQE